jgi:hypothetical protein
MPTYFYFCHHVKIPATIVAFNANLHLFLPPRGKFPANIVAFNANLHLFLPPRENSCHHRGFQCQKGGIAMPTYFYFCHLVAIPCHHVAFNAKKVA